MECGMEMSIGETDPFQSKLFFRGFSRLGTVENSIPQMHYAVGKFPGRKQFERDGPALRHDERYAFANQDRDHVKTELIDLSFVEKSGDDLAAAHDPDILTWHCPQALRKWLDRLPREFEALQEPPLWLAGEHIALDIRAESAGLHPHLDSLGVGLSPPEDRIDALHKSGHTVVSLGLWAVEPGDIAIRTRYKAVRADRDMYDKFSGPFHAAASPLNFAKSYLRDWRKSHSKLMHDEECSWVE